MITLKTKTGSILADVFITENEHSIGVVLYRDGRPIAADTFDASTLRRLRTVCLDWLSSHDLDKKSLRALSATLKENFETLERLRAEGPGASAGWLGSRGSRRIPNIHEDRPM